MSRFEYFLAFETILYGLVLAHAVIGFSQMIYHRKTIKFYWAHTLACITIFFVVIQTYYTLFWVPYDTVKGPWTFFFLRIFPLTLLYITIYQLFPEKPKKLKAEPFMYSRVKEMLLPTVFYNLLAVTKTIYYRWDEYVALGDGLFFYSRKFALFVIPFLFISGICTLMIFKFPKKIFIEIFIVFLFLVTMAMMSFTPTPG